MVKHTCGTAALVRAGGVTHPHAMNQYVVICAVSGVMMQYAAQYVSVGEVINTTGFELHETILLRRNSPLAQADSESYIGRQIDDVDVAQDVPPLLAWSLWHSNLEMDVIVGDTHTQRAVESHHRVDRIDDALARAAVLDTTCPLDDVVGIHCADGDVVSHLVHMVQRQWLVVRHPLLPAHLCGLELARVGVGD
ncbi:MAG: hypothetical protein KatS3mg038_1125 [Candidatus Kapaibacterium sp.]|nr:MAG: hypothetical protein KatS3mg038_1125 [Candidatus Kapabacteria bacterium]